MKNETSMTGFLTHRRMIMDRRQRNALKGQFISAQGNALGKQDTPPPQRPERAA